MSPKLTRIDDKLYDYYRTVGFRDTDLLRRLRSETAQQPMARMQISAEQGQFMKLLVKLCGVRLALEIGTFTGYSALCIAEALPVSGRLIACDINREYTNIARRYWQEAGVADRIDLRLQPALQTIDDLIAAEQSGAFDFIFIDADKENINTYYEGALKLLRSGGMVVIDNTFWDGRVADPAENGTDTIQIRALNAKIHADARVELSMIPIGDGLTLVRKV